MAAAGVIVLAAIGANWGWLRLAGRAPEQDRTVKRLQIRLPNADPLAPATSMPLGLARRSLAIDLDGERVAYVLERQGSTQLYVHELDQVEPVALDGTQGAFAPFFSPDGRWIGFFAENRLKKVAVSGGEPIDLCAAPNPYGGSWGSDGHVLFSADEGRRLSLVSENGGSARRVPVKNDQGSWRYPDILPGGRGAILSNPMLGVAVLSLESGEFRVLVEGAGGGRYAAGHVIFARPGVLLAAPFDPQRLTLTGPEALVLSGVRTVAEGAGVQPQAAFSTNGTLIYAAGAARDMTRPVWVDRRGKVKRLDMPAKSYGTMSLSPDERSLAVIIADPKRDVWIHDLKLATLTRLTFGVEPERVSWTEDGRRIAFGYRRGGKRASFSMPKDGSREPEPLIANDGESGLEAASPGRLVATVRGGAGAGLDLWVRDGTQPPKLFLRTPFTEAGPAVSPDERWIAYVSDESGQYEVYVRPYPAREGKWRISADGGEEPMWSGDGTELFYRNGGKWMAAAVTLEPEFSASRPTVLFEGNYVNVGGVSYDVTKDGQRFLLLEPVEPDERVTYLNIVLNWLEDVRQKTSPSE